jgi:hypothetical protein
MSECHDDSSHSLSQCDRRFAAGKGNGHAAPFLAGFLGFLRNPLMAKLGGRGLFPALRNIPQPSRSRFPEAWYAGESPGNRVFEGVTDADQREITNARASDREAQALRSTRRSPIVVLSFAPRWKWRSRRYRAMSHTLNRRNSGSQNRRKLHHAA